VTDSHKLAVKLFARDPGAVALDAFIPVFHRWIQERRVEGILVDVADYTHLHDGPGVVLVGHEADYSMDRSEGPLGLLYSRKQSLPGAPAERIRAAFLAALAGAAKLEAEPEFRGKLKFRAEEALVLSNDRLLAPNAEATFAAWRPHLLQAFGGVYRGARVELAREATDPRRRFAVRVRTPEPVGASDLIARAL
jgi:hypothetical protein